MIHADSVKSWEREIDQLKAENVKLRDSLTREQGSRLVDNMKMVEENEKLRDLIMAALQLESVSAEWRRLARAALNEEKP